MTTGQDYATQQQDEINRDIFRYEDRSMVPGGERIPVQRFVGTCTGWDVRQSQFPNQPPNVVLFFDKCEIIETEEEWPSDKVELAIKHSKSERSVYGFLAMSLYELAGASKAEDRNMDLFEGLEAELYKERFNWGRIPNATNADENGNVWGDIWKAKKPDADRASATGGQTATTTAADPTTGSRTAGGGDSGRARA